MNVLGKWKLVSILGFDVKTMEQVWLTNEDLGNLPDGDFQKSLYNAVFEFKEGELKIYCAVQIPPHVTEEEIKAAIEAGEITEVDGKYMMAQTKPWKEEDGVIKVDSGERGEVFGEAIDPWKAVEEVGNTLIISGQYQIVREGETPTEVKKTVKEEKMITEEMKAAAGTYKGLYTKFVGAEEKDESKPFKLVLKEDGTGTHFRNDLEIKIPDWSIENGEIKLTEKFLGTIDYTGKLDGNSLTLFNDDPEKPLTCSYVYEKE